MRKNMLALQQKLIIQSDMMIPVGETPVLEVLNTASVGALAIKAVNFLRCGCPSVQIAFTPDYAGYEGELLKFGDDLGDFFANLALGEIFPIEIPPMDWKDGVLPSGWVISVTRVISEKK